MDYLTIFTIGGIAFSLSLFTQLINKLLINEKRVNQITVDMKQIQQDLKKLDPKGKEFSKIQEKMLDLNLERMQMQFKPLMFTFLPYIIIFYLISGMFAFAPMEVGSTIHMQVTGTGHIFSECLGIDQDVTDKLDEWLTIGLENCSIVMGETETNLELGSKLVASFSSGNMEVTISPEHQQYIPLPVDLPIVGTSLGWLGTYILCSFLSSMVLSKLLKGVYLRKWE